MNACHNYWLYPLFVFTTNGPAYDTVLRPSVDCNVCIVTKRRILSKHSEKANRKKYLQT